MSAIRREARSEGPEHVAGGNGLGFAMGYTAATIEQTRAAQSAGADAALIVRPYYNRPTKEGLYRHYAAVASAVDLPIVLYNVPARTGVDPDVGTVEQLRTIPSIIGIKDASRDPGESEREGTGGGHRFIQFCGDEAGAVAFDFDGGRGCIAVATNVAPALCRALQQACRVKDWAQARFHPEQPRPADRCARVRAQPGPHQTGIVASPTGVFQRAPSPSGGRRPGHGLGDRACTEGPRSRHAAGRPESGRNRSPRPLPDQDEASGSEACRSVPAVRIP